MAIQTQFRLLNLNLLRKTACGSLLLPLRLLWVLTLGFPGCISGETVDKGNNNLLDIDFGVELSSR